MTPYQKQYYARPEIVARGKVYRKQYYSRPETIAKREAYFQRPETKEKVKVYYSKKPHRKNYLRRLYNLTLEQYQKMFEDQQGKCAICENGSMDQLLSVDHCHKTDKVRGLLCSGCNMAIGHLKEDPKILLRAISYLTKDA